jgi:hypothetical protein
MKKISDFMSFPLWTATGTRQGSPPGGKSCPAAETSE